MNASRFITLAFGLCSLMSTPCLAQATIQLPSVDFPRAMSLADALQKRRSVRDFTDARALSDQTLANLLWAACGISSDDGKITAPSAMNKQDIRLYVCRQDGAYLYIPQSNTLLQVSDHDLRHAVADRQAFAAQAPLCLVLVSDTGQFAHNGQLMGAVDAGYVSQNICLACTALGLKTVPRMTMDQATLREALGLSDTMVLLLNHPVGY